MKRIRTKMRTFAVLKLIIHLNVNKKILAYANTSKTELLFLAQFVRSLEIGGRCASIVPEGVLFGTSKAHVAIRKEIVDNHCTSLCLTYT